MRRAAAVAAPVLLRFPAQEARAESWGRLRELTASSARLSTQAALSRRDRVLVCFELGGERFKDLPAAVEWVETDADGFFSVELRFSDEVEKRRLARALLDALAR